MIGLYTEFQEIHTRPMEHVYWSIFQAKPPKSKLWFVNEPTFKALRGLKKPP